jgi:hypothetical protein
MSLVQPERFVTLGIDPPKGTCTIRGNNNNNNNNNKKKNHNNDKIRGGKTSATTMPTHRCLVIWSPRHG